MGIEVAHTSLKKAHEKNSFKNVPTFSFQRKKKTLEIVDQLLQKQKIEFFFHL